MEMRTEQRLLKLESKIENIEQNVKQINEKAQVLEKDKVMNNR